MSKIVWDQPKDRLYETGVSHGVLYVQNDLGAYGEGVPWNGLTAVTNSASGSEANTQYADNIKYAIIYSREEFGLTIEAFTYPDEFLVCDGTQQPVDGQGIIQQFRRTFGFCYRTIIGNAIDGEDFGYKIHIVYGCKASPTEKNYQTIAENAEPVSFSWEVKTNPIEINGYKPASEVILDSTLISEDALKEIEGWLYGSETNEPTLLMPDEITEIISLNSDWLYSYSDPGSDGGVKIRRKARRIQTYSYVDEGEGNVVITPLAERSYSYSDTTNEGDVLIEEVSV